MRHKIIRPERRQLIHRPGYKEAFGDDGADAGQRRVHCWDLDPSIPEERHRRCAAHFVRRNCWDLWAAEYFPPGRKPCCHPEVDCADCALAASHFADTIPVYVEVPARAKRAPTPPPAQIAEQSVPRCTYLQQSIDSSLARIAEGRAVYKCQRRPGVQLHGSYVGEVCRSMEHRECIFYSPE